MNKLDHVLPVAEQTEFERSLSNLAPRAIRLHVDCNEFQLPFETESVPWSKLGRVLVSADIRPASFLEYATADYYIQDAGSLLPIELLNVQPHETVLDLCAAPGGKASAIAEQLNERGCLVANENIQSRVDVLRYSLARTQRPFYVSCSHDPTILESQLKQTFDAVLVDAPCSGQMLVSKSKHDDNAFSPKHIAHCASRQQRILRSAVSMLKPGGRLIYSTCTFAVEENEDQISWLCNTFPGAFEPIELQSLAPWKSPLQAGCYRLWPHRDRCAGGFAAGLTLKDADQIEHTDDETANEQIADERLARVHNAKMRSKRNDKKTDRDAKVLAEILEQLNEIGELQNCKLVYDNGGTSITAPGTEMFLANHPHLEAQSAPALIAMRDHWIPSHALAMLSPRYFQSTNVIDIDHHSACQFVMGNSLSPKEQNSRKRGWHIVTYHNRSLGWVKASEQRWNNHLPAWARLNSLT